MTPEPIHLTRVEFASVVATERTEWTFARIHDAAGVSADVELTSGDDTCEVVRLVTDAAASLKGAPIASEADVPTMLGLDERRPEARLRACYRGERPAHWRIDHSGGERAESA